MDLPGYLDTCGAAAACLPDMLCIEDVGGGTNPQMICIFTCDTAMGVCPEQGTCLDTSEGAATGMCMPAGDGTFADPCSFAEGCVSGLICTPLDYSRPGYCNRMCSSMFPCPAPFECMLPDGMGGNWCAAPCSTDSECAVLGDWSCFLYAGGMGVCLPNWSP